jgi:hypothetical protein
LFAHKREGDDDLLFGNSQRKIGHMPSKSKEVMSDIAFFFDKLLKRIFAVLQC